MRKTLRRSLSSQRKDQELFLDREFQAILRVEYGLSRRVILAGSPIAAQRECVLKQRGSRFRSKLARRVFKQR